MSDICECGGFRPDCLKKKTTKKNRHDSVLETSACSQEYFLPYTDHMCHGNGALSFNEEALSEQDPAYNQHPVQKPASLNGTAVH